MRMDILKVLMLGMALGIPSSTQAGQFIPPDNIPACSQSGGVLVWNTGISAERGGAPGYIECIGINTESCPQGQVMTGISAGVPVCVPQTQVTNVACPAGEVLISISEGTQSTCANPVAGLNGSCSGNQVMVSINGGSPVCANPSSDVSIATCPPGMAMTGISNGSPVCAAMAASGFPRNHGIIGNTYYYFGCQAWTDGNGTAYMTDEYQGNGAADLTTNHIATFGHACPGTDNGGICMVDVTGLTNTCNGVFYPW